MTEKEPFTHGFPIHPEASKTTFMTEKECKQHHDLPVHRLLPTTRMEPRPVVQRCWRASAPTRGGRTPARRLANRRTPLLWHATALPPGRTLAGGSRQGRRRACSLCCRSIEGSHRRQDIPGGDLFPRSPEKLTL